MKIYTFSEARQNLATLLNEARFEEVVIRRRDGSEFSVQARTSPESPFDVPAVDTDVTLDDIVEAIRETRQRGG